MLVGKVFRKEMKKRSGLGTVGWKSKKEDKEEVWGPPVGSFQGKESIKIKVRRQSWPVWRLGGRQQVGRDHNTLILAFND